MKNSQNSNTRTGKYLEILPLILSLCLMGSTFGYAQLRIVPIGTAVEEAFYPSNDNARTQALSLPFFDDFSISNDHPSQDNWMPGGGVYINNTLATSQPSLNFATFDGLSASGRPYNQTNPLFKGATDTLTSQPVNLSGLTARDSVYLSFQWLAKGLGEQPDTLDSFVVEFKNDKNEWKEMWKNDGQLTQDSLFTQGFVRIVDPAFFYAGFQFRFRSIGNLSGPYDTWHLDYIYLNKNRSIKSRYLIDAAARRPLTSLLKNYRSVPLRHFRFNPAAVRADRMIADVKNNNNAPNFLTSNFTLTNTKTKQVYLRNFQGTSVGISALGTRQFEIPLSTLTIPGNEDEVTLQSEFYLITSDDKEPGVNLFRNDTIRAVTTLGNYYAYDDGSAEAAVQVNQKLARAAIRFNSIQPDTLRGVALNIMPYGGDITGQSFTIQIWKDKDGKPGELLGQRSVAAKYPSGRNGVVEFLFTSDTSGIAVPAVFYVGWLQVNEPYLAIGYDKNSSMGKDHIFYNLGSEWVQDKSLTGSVMLRPIIGGKDKGKPLGVEPVSGRQNLFFPNPAQNVVSWEKTLLKQIDVYSVQGIRLKSFFPRADDRSLSVEGFDSGIYLFKATDGKQNFVQKMLIVR